MFKTTKAEFVPATDQLFSHCVTEDKMRNTFGKKNLQYFNKPTPKPNLLAPVFSLYCPALPFDQYLYLGVMAI